MFQTYRILRYLLTAAIFWEMWYTGKKLLKNRRKEKAYKRRLSGQVYGYVFEGFEIPVVPIDTKTENKEDYFLITPMFGNGNKWVKQKEIRKSFRYGKIL